MRKKPEGYVKKESRALRKASKYKTTGNPPGNSHQRRVSNRKFIRKATKEGL